MNKLCRILIALCCLLLVTTPTWADKLPDYYPDSFDGRGTIDLLDIGSGSIVISDTRMQLSSQLKVHSLNTRFSSLKSLHKGMNVGVDLGGNKVINEIWILPRNYGHYTE